MMCVTFIREAPASICVLVATFKRVISRTGTLQDSVEFHRFILSCGLEYGGSSDLYVHFAVE